MKHINVAYGIDKASPGGDELAISIGVGKKVSTFVGDEARAILAVINKAKVEENEYHWHHQKAIEKEARSGGVSGWFIDRMETLINEGS